MTALTIVVTGATGFLGQYVVAEALQRGHRVRALTRQAKLVETPAQAHERLQWRQVNMETGEGLDEALNGADVLIHLAAAKAGGLNEQLAGTVEATSRVLDAMDRTALRRIVVVGSFSVYDYQRILPGSTLDENAPIEPHPERRDAYARSKLKQEELVTEHARARGWTCHVLRIGAIYGKDHLWTARLGARLGGRVWARIGSHAPLPLVYVENCAEAVVQAAERETPGVSIVNIVDDNPPTQAQYARLLRSRMPRRPFTVVVPRFIVSSAASMADGLNRALFRGRLKLPGLLVPARFDARFKSLNYTNARAKETLGWRSKIGLEEAIERSVR